MLNFKKERINRKKFLGKGNFGVVRPYQKHDQDEKWAVKIIKAFTFKDVIDSFREIALGFSCDSPYILPVRGYFIDHDQEREEWEVCIKLPRTKEGNLRHVLNTHKQEKKLIPESDIAQYFYEIACGLQYLHNRGIAHRDIKPENILFDRKDNTVRIADFGLGDLQEGETTYTLAEKAGTLLYAAPENRDLNANLHKGDLFRADLWSLGMVLFELCTQVELKNLNLVLPKDKLEEDLRGRLDSIKKEKRYSQALVGLIEGLLRCNPMDRKSLKDVQEVLISTFGTTLRYSKTIQMESGVSQNNIQAKLDEIEKELAEKDRYVLGKEKYYKEIIKNLESELEKIKQSLRETESRASVATAQSREGSAQRALNQDLQAKLDEIQKELAVKDVHLNEIEKGYKGTITSLEEELAEAKKSLSKTRTDQEKLKSSEQNLQARLQQIQRELAGKEAYVAGIEKKHDENTRNLENQLAQMRINVRDSKAEQTQLRNSEQSLRAKIDKMQKELESKDVYALENEEQLQETIEELKAKVEKAQKDLKKSKSAKEKLEEDNLAFNGKLQKLQKELDEKNSALNALDGIDANSKTIIEKLEKELKDMEQKFLRKQDELTLTTMTNVLMAKWQDVFIINLWEKEVSLYIKNGADCTQNLWYIDRQFPAFFKEMAQTYGNVYSSRGRELIENLKMSFGGCQPLGDYVVKIVVSELGTTLKYLTSLYLDFGGIRGMSNVGLEQVASCIGLTLKNLKTLSINMTGTQATKAGAEAVRKQHLNYISNVTISTSL